MSRSAGKKIKTLRRVHVPGAIDFVTASTRRRAPILRGKGADAVSEAFQQSRAQGRASVLAYVVMPDHIHALLRPEAGAPIGKIVAFIKHVSMKAIKRDGHAGRVWEERFYDRVMRTEDELRNAIAYIHANPVRAGLCPDEREWRWSTANPMAASDLETVMTCWNRATRPISGSAPDESAA